MRLQENWDKLHELVATFIKEPEPYKNLLVELCLDSEGDQGQHILGMKRAPAAKRNHHAYEGGLVAHYIEMWGTWLALKDRVWKVVPGHLDDDRILRAIINHDIHKAYYTFELVNDFPWQTQYTNHLNEKYMTWGGKCIWILGQNGVELDALQMNALQNSEGGWAESPPRYCSVLAKAAYLLDESSGNVMSRIEDETLANIGVV